MATPKSPLTAAIKQKVENCHRRLAQKDQSDLAMAGELNELWNEISSLEHRYQAKLPEQVANLIKPLSNQTFKILTREGIIGNMAF